MLHLKIAITPEGWDEKTQQFVDPEYVTLKLEHSLVSLSKWESKWCKPFLSKESKSPEETIDYIRCMTIDDDVDPVIYALITNEHINQVNDYIAAPMTATTFYEDKTSSKSKETITSELVYYWMVALTIPFECQYWHLNRLLTLVRVCNIKNSPPKKRSKSEIMSRNAALNAQRRAQMNSKG